MAASQQLVEESALGRRQSTQSRKSTLKSRLNQVSTSPPEFSSQPSHDTSPLAVDDDLGPADTDKALQNWPVSPIKSSAPKGLATTPHGLIVPDSQFKSTPPNAIDALMSPPATSSTRTLANSHRKMADKNRKRSSIAKDKPTILSEEHDVLGPDEDTMAGAIQTVEPSSSQHNRKITAAEVDAVLVSQDAHPVPASPEMPQKETVKSKPVTITRATTLNKRAKDTTPKHTDDDNHVTGDEGPRQSSQSIVKKSRGPRKSNPRFSEKSKPETPAKATSSGRRETSASKETTPKYTVDNYDVTGSETPDRPMRSAEGKLRRPTKDKSRVSHSLAPRESTPTHADDEHDVTGIEIPERPVRSVEGKLSRPSRFKPRHSEARQNSKPITPESEPTSEQQAWTPTARPRRYDWAATVRNVDEAPGDLDTIDAEVINSLVISSSEDELQHAPNNDSVSPSKAASRPRVARPKIARPRTRRSKVNTVEPEELEEPEALEEPEDPQEPEELEEVEEVDELETPTASEDALWIPPVLPSEMAMDTEEEETPRLEKKRRSTCKSHQGISRTAPEEAPHTVLDSPVETRMNTEEAETPQIDRKRGSTRRSHGDDSLTAAEKALANERDLNARPDRRTSGNFTQDEDELIRRAIKDYQDRRGLETSDLVDVIHWKFARRSKHNGGKGPLTTKEDKVYAAESKEFWDELKLIDLPRNWTMVKQHVRSQYHSFKSGAWTAEEDEQLKDLAELHPNCWTLISTIMEGRSVIDCHNRFKDYIQHGDARNTSHWSQDEEQLLLRALTTVLQRDEDRRAETQQPSLAVYTNADINWTQVAKEMGDIRSRLQCTMKWTRMQARDPPAKIELDYQPGRESQIVEPTSKKRGRPRKSDAPDLQQAVPHTPRKRSRPRKDGVATDPRQVLNFEESDKFKQMSAQMITLQQQVEALYTSLGARRLSQAQDMPQLSNEIVDSDDDSSLENRPSKRLKPSEPEPEAPESEKDMVDAETREVAETETEEESFNNPSRSASADAPVAAVRAIQQTGAIVTTKRNASDAVPGAEFHQDAVTYSTGQEAVSQKRQFATITSPPTPLAMLPVRSKDAPQMQWSDRFNLVEVLIQLDPEDEEDVSWFAVAGIMKPSWPVRTMQTNVRRLLDLVEDQGTFTGNLAAVRVLMTQQLQSGKQKNDDYPEQGKEDEVMEEAVADEEPPKASPRKSERRKVVARKSVPRSRASPVEKKRKVYSKLPPLRSSSTESGSDGDDGDSEFSV